MKRIPLKELLRFKALDKDMNNAEYYSAISSYFNILEKHPLYSNDGICYADIIDVLIKEHKSDVIKELLK